MSKITKKLNESAEDVEDLSNEGNSSKENHSHAGNGTESEGSDESTTTTEAPNAGSTLFGSIVLLVISLIITH